MSEYQYYEWQTIDRLLTEAEQADVGRLSSHIEVGASQAVVTYSYSDFKHEPRDVLAQYFDAFLYQANWGTRILMFRFPLGLLDEEAVADYCFEEMIAFSIEGQFQILEIRFDDEGGDGWIEETSELSGMIGLRNDILDGDYRCLYLAWLKAVELGDPDELAELEEPPVPAGLRKLTPALKRFTKLFDINEDQIKSAAAASPTATTAISDSDLRKAISGLTREEVDDYLFRLAQGEAGLALALKHRLKGANKTSAAPAAQTRRTAEEIFQAAERLAEEEKIRQKIEAEKRRIEQLEILAKREPQVWQAVEALLLKGHGQYGQVVMDLTQLRALADYQKTRAAFNQRLRDLRGRYASRTALMARLNEAGLT